MKLTPEQNNWYQPEAEQYITVNEPGFLWQVDLAMMPVIKTKERDLFYQGVKASADFIFDQEGKFTWFKVKVDQISFEY